MTVATERAAQARQPLYLLRLYLDECPLERGTAPCTASVDDKCYFTFSTCKSIVGFTDETDGWDGDTHCWKFSTQNSYLRGALPLLSPDFTALAVKIDEENFLTERGNITFTLTETDALPFCVPEKATSPADSGYFLRNLIARNPNYRNRKVELLEGYAGMAEADFEIIWRGVIDNIKYQKNQAQVSCLDLLYLSTDTKYPNVIGDNNVVEDNPMSNSQSYVTLGSLAKLNQFRDATANEPRTIKIGNEYCKYTGKNTGNFRLTGLTRGALGSTAASHAQGTKVKQVLSYGSGASTGIEMDLVMLDLICNLGGISGEYMEVSSVSTTINDAGGISDSDTTVVITSATGFPTAGVIMMGTELCSYSASGTTLTIARGRFNTTAAAHDDGSTVYLTKVSYEKGLYHSGHLYYFIAHEEQSVSDFLKKIQLATMCNVFMNESGNIDFSVQAPPSSSASLKTITIEDFKGGEYDLDLNEDSRQTRIYVYHSPDTVDCEEESANFAWEVYADFEAEQKYSYGDIKSKDFYCQFINRSTEAEWLASKLYYRYKVARPKSKIQLELKDADIGVGDLVNIEIPEIVKSDGSVNSAKLYRVISKQKKRFSSYEFEFQEAGFGMARYATIGKKNMVLNANLAAGATSLTLTVAAAAYNELTFADWNTSGHIWILNDGTNAAEKIKFTSVTDNTITGYITLGGLTRGADGTADVPHLAGVDVLQCYSAQASDYQDAYASFGDAENMLDSDGDLTTDEEGYYF